MKGIGFSLHITAGTQKELITSAMCSRGMTWQINWVLLYELTGSD
jgi:hypothetical protein